LLTVGVDTNQGSQPWAVCPPTTSKCQFEMPTKQYKIITMKRERNIDNMQNGRVAGGLILVAVGLVFLLRNMGMDDLFPNWLFSWQMLLIVIGIYSGFKHNFRNNAWLILISVGGFFLISEFIPELGLKPLFWPIVIICTGIIFIIRPGKKEWLNFKNDINIKKMPDLPGMPLHATATDVPSDRNDYLFIRSVFSGVVKNMVSKNFRGGNISCVFGGAEVDCSQADINGSVVIKLDVVFGGAKIVVPAHWAVQNEIDGLFHGIDDKRRFNPDASINPGKVLVLKGSVVFGGVEIRSY
jgi:hypothetical protein